MAEGFTNIYLDDENTAVLNKLVASLENLDVFDIERCSVEANSINVLSFDHNGSYNENKLTGIIKNLIAESPEALIRARHYDEYGTEIFWLNDNGKLKKYLHEVDAENGNISKAYNHWHSQLGSIWDGHFDKEDIQRISERFGFYDENGKAIKGDVENLANIITSSDSFFHKNIKAPYASHKFDNNIAVLQSYAAIMVSKTEFLPVDKSIRFERTFIVKDAFGSDVIGFVWSWAFGDLQAFLILTWHGDLAVKAKIVVNHENLTPDEIIYISVFDEFMKDEVLGNKQWVHGGLEQIVWPPSMEYVWDDSERDREKYYAQDIVLQFMHVDIYKGENGNYRVESQDLELFEIDDEQFVSEIDAIGPEVYKNVINENAPDRTAVNTPRIRVQIQVQFKGKDIAGKVLGVEVYGGENAKCIYRRHDPPSETWVVPDAP